MADNQPKYTKDAACGWDPQRNQARPRSTKPLVGGAWGGLGALIGEASASLDLHKMQSVIDAIKATKVE